MTIADNIRTKLENALSPESLSVIDESHLHAGHAGARPQGESHFRLEIVSRSFDGKSRIERQRMIYALLDEEFASGLHALSIKARAPEES